MMKASAVILPCGKRLHLQHGPIDLIIGCDQLRDEAFSAASNRFETVLVELVEELPDLRQTFSPHTSKPKGHIANLMHEACLPYARDHFVTRMAAVAGCVADTILETMKSVGPINKAYVNNGGDIALHLQGEEQFVTAMAAPDGKIFGKIALSSKDAVCGIATSGRHGRSFSLGIADSVTVLAKNSAAADVAATLIANEIDIPNHPSINRVEACLLDPDSDLGERLVVTDCKQLTTEEQNIAVTKGEQKSKQLLDLGLIKGAAIFFQGESRIIGSSKLSSFANNLTSERAIQYA